MEPNGLNNIKLMKPSSEHVQRNILENKIKLHKASKCDTVESKKLSIQHICQALGTWVAICNSQTSKGENGEKYR